MTTVSAVSNSTTEDYTKLYDKWTYWAHLPHDTDWSHNSYKKLLDFDKLEALIAINEQIPEEMVSNCMLFMMRQGIMPIWEDIKNRDGGCFSYKVPNNKVYDAWNDLSYYLVGESLTTDKRLEKIINGITISPKKSFCIIKIWLKNCLIQNAKKIVKINNLDQDGVLFRKHQPEY
jgi:hypothetical protein